MQARTVTGTEGRRWWLWTERSSGMQPNHSRRRRAVGGGGGDEIWGRSLKIAARGWGEGEKMVVNLEHQFGATNEVGGMQPQIPA